MNQFKKILIVAGISLAASTASNAATITVDMVSGGDINSTRMTTLGDSISVDVLIGNVVDLAGFEFKLFFDSSVLHATSVMSGSIFGFDTFSVDNTSGASSISFAEASLAPSGLNFMAPALLATITFDVIGSGFSAVSLADTLLSDSFASAINDVSTVDGELTARVDVPPSVPEPSILALFSMAGLALFGIKRHRNNTAHR
jgi:hypothetical protein